MEHFELDELEFAVKYHSTQKKQYRDQQKNLTEVQFNRERDLCIGVHRWSVQLEQQLSQALQEHRKREALIKSEKEASRQEAQRMRRLREEEK